MSISRIGAGCPAWRDMGKAQRNGSGTGFAGRMAGTDTVRAGSGDNYIYLKAGKRFSAHDAYSIMGNMASRFKTNNLKAETKQPVEKVGSEKLRELADMYKEKYPNLIKSESVAMGFAQAEAAGQAVRTEDGIMMITCNGMNYMDDANPSKSWAVMYPTGATHMYMEIMNAMAEGHIEAKDIAEYSKWEEYFEERGLEFERILSDEELEQVDKQESDSKTDIIVKPDGSRVLVVTTDNNMPSDDTRMDTVLSYKGDAD